MPSSALVLQLLTEHKNLGAVVVVVVVVVVGGGGEEGISHRSKC